MLIDLVRSRKDPKEILMLYLPTQRVLFFFP